MSDFRKGRVDLGDNIVFVWRDFGDEIQGHLERDNVYINQTSGWYRTRDINVAIEVARKQARDFLALVPEWCEA